MGGCKAEVEEAAGAGGYRCHGSHPASAPGWTWPIDLAGGCGGAAGSGGVWAFD